MRKTIKLKVLAGILLLGRLAVPADPDGFVGQGLCQFRVYNYRLTPQTEAAIDQVVAKAYAQHAKVFAFALNPQFRVHIRLFGRFEDYQAFTRTNRATVTPNGSPLNVTNLAGYYSPAKREVVTWRQHVPSYLANNILHESSHAIMDAHFRRVPQWLLEGCASYFSFPRFMQDQDDVHLLQRRWLNLERWRNEGTLPTAASFVNLSWAGWHQLEPEKAMTVSWSLFQFFMSSEAHQQVMRAMLARLQTQRAGEMDCATLLNELYPGGAPRLEQDWHRWIMQASRKVLGQSRPG